MGSTNLFRSPTEDKSAGGPVMVRGQNITVRIDGHTLTLTIDLSHNLGLSKSGKSSLIATTNGNVTLPGGEKLGVNLFRVAR